ncbi:MAG: outer membrane protein assembly factor BamE [Pseudomonadales bacterium]|nr:outer membrane protein assembly factor BamE [Pseudomonadales bacterium]
MKKSWLPGLCLSILLSFCTACSVFPGVYKLEVQQGNIVDQEMIDTLKPGMTRRQVRFVMGTPLIVDTFNPDRWDYYYSIRTSDDAFTEKRISLIFENDALVGFSGDYIPTSSTPGEAMVDDLGDIPEGLPVGDPHDVDAIPAEPEKKPWWKW